MIAQCIRNLLLLVLSIGTISCVHGSGTDAASVKKRLATLEYSIPLPYHDALIDNINHYTDKQLPANFTLFEDGINEEMQQYGLPPELIYLPLALTNLDPNFNHDERAGIWALPALVALHYGLKVDQTHDERYAVEASTRAAVHYLTDLYGTYGDWWQCILAYANSPAALQNAMTRHPEAGTNPWVYYENDWLPNVKVVSDFIACYYVYSSDDKSIAHSTEQYDLCAFDQPVSLAVVSTVTGIKESRIKSLNPVFKTDPVMPLEGNALRLPHSAASLFESNKERIYSETAARKTKEEAAVLAAKEKEKKEIAQHVEKERSSITYTVKLGDTLGKIAQQHHVKVNDLKKWNHLKGDFIREKQKLVIYQ